MCVPSRGLNQIGLSKTHGRYTSQDNFWSLAWPSLHEILAFVEAVTFVSGRGIAFEDVALYTDDERIGYAPFHLHPENYCGHPAQALRELLARAVSICGLPPAMADTSERFLRAARIHKVKGHSRLVYQERADHLARAAARSMTDTPYASSTFMEWLQRGVMFYSSKFETAQFWHPAFCKPAELEHAAAHFAWQK